MAKVLPYILILVLGGLFTPPIAKAEQAENFPRSIEWTIGMGAGIDSNLFFATRDPESDTFIILDANLSAIWPIRQGFFLITFLDGNYKRFSTFDQANETYLNWAGLLRKTVLPRWKLGVSNALSYIDLNLLDTEGESLPIEKFRAVSDRLRASLQFERREGLQVDTGIFYRIFDVDETENQPSLDFTGYGGDVLVGKDISQDLFSRLRYQIQVLDYRERQAQNRSSSNTGIVNNDNPTLMLIRQDILASVEFQGLVFTKGMLTAKFRFNRDTFEDDLTYFQQEVVANVGVGGLGTLMVTAKVTLRNRRYSDRSREVGSQTNLAERYAIGQLEANRKLWKNGSLYADFEVTRKQSNDPFREFNRQQITMGIRGQW